MENFVFSLNATIPIFNYYPWMGTDASGNF